MENRTKVCRKPQCQFCPHIYSGNTITGPNNIKYSIKVNFTCSSTNLDVVSYEEVLRLPAFKCKTLVVIGASGVGQSHIKYTLLIKNPEKFGYLVPYMTQPQQKNEVDGKGYHFVFTEEMMRDVSANEFLEFGSF
ncbi:hypothetical protein JRQ81_015309 [Phrynocephalus forsythii]|uniref:Guanylate kinase-like domain-containing protein n=1 Tax=Phrynocephalus forsythii TaxID=171643 RepID=A0A9Q1B1M6_9SAUR|nr:hypothetical protein JRQ81_015309 [Phrynocephalus forsythii]